MIHFKNVTKKYNEVSGINDVTLDIEKGEFVFVVGPSGAGKSTFIKLIMKEVEADKGSIMVMDNEVSNMPNRKLPKHRRNIGMIFQDFRLLPNKTVYENVAFAMEIVHKSQKQIKKQVPLALSLMGISGKSNMFPHELSAGEQQRVAIARAIINKPAMLIADEPTGNLDPDTAWEIMNLLDEINRRGTTIVMVTHAKDIVDKMRKRVVTIDSGEIVSDYVGVYRMQDISNELAKQLDENQEMTIGDYMVMDKDVSENSSDADSDNLETEIDKEDEIVSDEKKLQSDSLNEDTKDNVSKEKTKDTSNYKAYDYEETDNFVFANDIYEPSSKDIDKYIAEFEDQGSKQLDIGGENLE